ncbi:hssA/B-like protein 36 [Drosophila kikkawai]|uniref:HssA/B-like protein 36 n=1 Tax=Drosophila kikkawai TaxID=30033 RepID=A0A6P4JF67_DROKI|nr:glycine-rich protein 23-like [Drosophila kikkawai]
MGGGTLGGGGGSTIGGGTLGGGSVLGHGTAMSSSTVGMGPCPPPGTLMHGANGGNGGNPGNVYGNGNGGVGGQNTAPGSVIDSRAVSVVVTLPGGPGAQHPGQALSDYGPI